MSEPASSPLIYPHPAPPPAGALIEVAPGVHWLRMPLPFALNHINLWALEDDNGWCLIDTGYGTDTTLAIWQQLFDGPLSGRPVTRIIVTHYHPDHVGSAAWLVDRWRAEFWMTEAEFLTAHAMRAGIPPFAVATAQAHFRRHGLDEERLKAQETRGNAYCLGVPALPNAYRRMIDGDVLTIGNRTWRVRTAFGHAPEHATLYCEALGVLISGDQILPKITTNVGVWANQPDGNPLKLFLDSFDRFAPLPENTLVLPSHGLVFTGMHTRIRQLHDHHEARLAELVATLDAPRTAAELLPTLFPRPLDDHQLMFAMGEIIAHLNFLMHAGSAYRETDADGQIRYIRLI